MKITVIILTYNHEEYIGQALESVLNQEIDVPVELLIFDDASTDNTQNVIRDYKRRYPGRLKTFFRKQNSNHLTKNCYYALSKATGNYVAFLEGDDYWIDNHKLKKQYNFLEKNPEYSACTGVNICIDDDGKFYDDKQLYVDSKKYPQGISLADFKKGVRTGHASTLFIRNLFTAEKFKILYQASNSIGDTTVEILCLVKGNIYRMADEFSVRRVTRKEGGVNFSSIHLNNKYWNYARICYFLRLENHVRKHYEPNFTFEFLFRWLLLYCRDLPFEAYLRLISLSGDKWHYARLILILKLFSKNYDIEYLNKRKNPYSFRKLLNEKKRIVLFGAGEMAREYLDNEGWRELPIFIADNDSLKHGQSFKGLIIKKPEEILSIKDKAAVLITSVNYEKEIAVQLEEMGINDYYFYCGMKSWKYRDSLASWLLG
ncbi:MAG: glycosyltransferase [Lachnospiraceae bacterium]|nr:glycosyltransferase [Lachnospiraceae bacterium]